MSDNSIDTTALFGRTIVVVSIMLTIAAVHFLRLGTLFEGRLFTLYYGYFSDIIVPFGMYFLLCINDASLRFLRDWRIKAVIVFTISSLTEVGQAFGVPLLGQTFDPMDFVMFGVGVLLAVMVDRLLFVRIFSFWSRPE